MYPFLLHYAENGTVQFDSASSTAPHSGRVEAFIYGEWRDVCPNRVDSKRYICNQLGYSTDVTREIETREALQSALSPDWDRSDERCQNDTYGTEGCVWYQKAQCAGRRNTIDPIVKCSGKYNVHGGTMYVCTYV